MSLTEEERRLQQSESLLSELGLGGLLYTPPAPKSTPPKLTPISEQYDDEEEGEGGGESEYYNEESSRKHVPTLVERAYGPRVTDNGEIYKELAQNHPQIPEQLAQHPPQYWEFLERQMDRGDILDKSPELQAFIRENPMPPRLRGKFWLNVTGGLAYMQAHPNAYARLRAECTAPNAPLASPFEKQIERDVSRITVGGDVMRTPEAAEHLRALLVTYSGQNPTIGYCQAMHLIGAHFLLQMDFDEERAYWAMDAVIRTILPSDFYSECMSGIKVEIATFNAISRHCYPKVLQHLDCLGVSVDMFLTAWFLSLFINILPDLVILRVLDLLFLEGFDVMYRVVLGLLKLHETEILACSETGSAMMIINTLPATAADPEALVAAMYSTKITDKAEIQACREVFTKQIIKGVKKSTLITLEEAQQMTKSKNEQKQQQPPQPQQKKMPPPPPKAQHPRSARRKTQIPKMPPPPPPKSKNEVQAKVVPARPPQNSTGDKAEAGVPQAKPSLPPKPKVKHPQRGPKPSTMPPPPPRSKPVIEEEKEENVAEPEGNPFEEEQNDYVEEVAKKPSLPPKLVRCAPQERGGPAKPLPRSNAIYDDDEEEEEGGEVEDVDRNPFEEEDVDRNPFGEEQNDYVEEAAKKPSLPPKLVRCAPQERGGPAKPLPRNPPKSAEYEDPFGDDRESAHARPNLPPKPTRCQPEDGAVRPKLLPQRPTPKATPVPPPKAHVAPSHVDAPKPLPRVQGKALPSKPLPSAVPQAAPPKLPAKPLPQKSLPSRPPAVVQKKTLPEVPYEKPLPQVQQEEEEEVVEEGGEEEYEDVFGDEYFDGGEQGAYDDYNNGYADGYDDDEDNPFFQ